MSERPEPKEFALADTERIVRTYACTRFHRLLAPTSTGYLTVTNRRIVYHCEGKLLVGGASVVVSEMPLDDVAGISSAVAFSVNYLMTVVFAALLFGLTGAAIAIAPASMTSWVVALVLALPYLVGLLFMKGVISEEIRDKIVRSFESTGIWKLLQRKDAAFYMRLFYMLALVALLLFTGRIAFGGRPGSRYLVLSQLPLVAVCLWIYRSAIRRSRAFSLCIAAKSSHGAGILIPGRGLLQFFGQDFAQLHSLWASPAEDSEQLVKELGALLTDIRLLGDLGIGKWTTQPEVPGT